MASSLPCRRARIILSSTEGELRISQFQRRSDDKIYEEIRELLTNSPDLDASEVELHVESGEVTLTGTIDSRDARWLAEDLVNSVTGVREVNNRLKVAR